MRKLASIIIAAVAFAGLSTSAFAQEAQNLDQLLELVKQGAYSESQENKRREREFVQQKTKQKSLLAGARNTQKQEERRSDRLEAEFKANDIKIAKLEEELSHELGALKELFGVLQQVSGDTKAVFHDSIISAQFPGREVYLDE